MEQRIRILDGIIEGDTLRIRKNKKAGFISREELSAIVEEFSDYLLYIEGEEKDSYDDSDDDRAGTYGSKSSFGYYYELDPEKNSQHLIRIDGRVRGVMFEVTRGYNEPELYPFLFDGTVAREMTLGWGASHSSHLLTVKRVSLRKRGEMGAPNEAQPISFRQSSTSTSL